YISLLYTFNCMPLEFQKNHAKSVLRGRREITNTVRLPITRQLRIIPCVTHYLICAGGSRLENPSCALPGNLHAWMITKVFPIISNKRLSSEQPFISIAPFSPLAYPNHSQECSYASLLERNGIPRKIRYKRNRMNMKYFRT